MESGHILRTSNSCGPDCVAFASGVPAGAIDVAWGIKDIRKFSNLADTPFNHFSTLAALGIPWQIRTCGEILAGVCKPGKSIILLHSKDHPLLAQHWVVLAGVQDRVVSVHWGDGTIKRFQEGAFTLAYSGGRGIGPQCAYEIGIGSTKLSWYQRFYAYITGIFI